jgi:hypothetical protein
MMVWCSDNQLKSTPPGLYLLCGVFSRDGTRAIGGWHLRCQEFQYNLWFSSSPVPQVTIMTIMHPALRAGHPVAPVLSGVKGNPPLGAGHPIAPVLSGVTGDPPRRGGPQWSPSVSGNKFPKIVLFQKINIFVKRLQVLRSVSDWFGWIGNPVKSRSCTRSCKSVKSSGIPCHCFSESEMGRPPEQDEPEDLPVTYFVAFGWKAKNWTCNVTILSFCLILWGFRQCNSLPYFMLLL